jgi:membrane fusion protein, multidrug efflux system
MRSIKLSVLIVCIVGAIGFYIYQKQSIKTYSKKGYATSFVTVKPLKYAKISPDIEAVGSTKAFESVTLSANVTEYVRKLYFNDGDFVKKGDILVELENEEEKAQIVNAKARLVEAQSHYKRTLKLLKGNYSAQSEHDTREANLKSAQAQLTQMHAKLKDKTIRAPFSGVLGFRLISEGTLLEPGDKIVTLDMIQPLKVDFTLAERYLSQLYKGQHFISFSVAYPDKTFKGKIATIRSRIDEQTRTVMVRGILDNKSKQLKPGMLLKIHIPLPALNVLVIPEHALVSRGKERFVFIVKNNKAKKIAITILQRKNDKLFVSAKVNEGDLLVIDGGFKLKDGMNVKYKNVTI